MREESRLEAEDEERDEAGGAGEHFAAGAVDEDGGDHREEQRQNADAEGEILSAVAGAAEEEFAAVEVGFVFEEAMLIRWDVEVEVEERDRGEHLDDGRVFGVVAVVVGLPGLVAGEDVVALVPREGLAVDGVEDGAGHDEEQRDDGDAVEGGAWCGHCGSGLFGIYDEASQEGVEVCAGWGVDVGVGVEDGDEEAGAGEAWERIFWAIESGF